MVLQDRTHLQIRSAPSAAAERLDRWLTARVAEMDDAPDLSRSRLKNLIRDGHVSIGDATISDPAMTVKPNRLYKVRVPAPTNAIPQPESRLLQALHEDEHLIVIDKPADMAVHPAPGTPNGTLVNALLAHCGDSLSGIGGVRRPGIVHRLDKDTTGLLVAAKNDETHHALAHQFAARTIGRSYLALVWGIPGCTEGRIEGAIGRSRRNRKKMAVVDRGGKSAATRFRVIERYHGIASLLQCQLETGRTHQIRVHLTHIGHPIVGDPVYGSGERRKGATVEMLAAVSSLGRQALHANALSFTHPATGQTIAFTSDPPAEMHGVIKIFAKSAKRP